jgi:hypothetical protein
VNNVIGLAKAAKVFGVPTILTTVQEERGGLLIKGIQDVFPEQKPINRTWINTWQDPRVRLRGRYPFLFFRSDEMGSVPFILPAKPTTFLLIKLD